MLPRLLAAATVLAGTLLVPLAGAAPAFVPLLFGHRWSPAAGGLAIACLAVVIHMPVVIAGQSYLWVAGDGKAPLRAMAADAVIVVVGGVALVPRFGVVGIGIAGVAAAIVHTAILVRAVDNHTGLGVFRHIRVPVLAWVVAAAVAWVCAELAGPLLVRTIISSLVAVSVYLGLLFLTRRELMVSIAGYARPWIERHLLRRKRVPVPVT